MLVVDDSALMRRLLMEIINDQPDMVCVGEAIDPFEAREMIRELSPDVLTLDIEMPRMDGIVFLERLMRLRPMPVVMVSTLTESGADITVRALELGAVDFIEKPRAGFSIGVSGFSLKLVEKIRIASQVSCDALKLRRITSSRPIIKGEFFTTGFRFDPKAVVFIGASTGGTEAIKEILMRLPQHFPPVAITQHMPAGFTKSFAKRLNNVCSMTVSEAVQGEQLRPGNAYIAPGGQQFSVNRVGANYFSEVRTSELVNRHRPSVDVLFRSAAKSAAEKALGVLLTGMGDDGAIAMKEMRDAGGYNIAQDEASCVVFGMPKCAINAEAVHAVLPLSGIAAALIAKLNGDFLQKR